MRAWIMAITLALAVSGSAAAQQDAIRPDRPPRIEGRQEDTSATSVYLCVAGEIASTPHAPRYVHSFQVTRDGRGAYVDVTPNGLRLRGSVSTNAVTGTVQADQLYEDQIDLLRTAALENISLRTFVNRQDIIISFHVGWRTHCS